MELESVEEGGVMLVVGRADARPLSSAVDATSVLESCFSAGSRAVLLYAEDLPAAFFDLSSGQAGAYLQKFRNYGVRLAVVSPPGRVRVSSRFGEMAAEEGRANHFRLFETPEDARRWLIEGAVGPSRPTTLGESGVDAEPGAEAEGGDRRSPG
jgi:hypothetical protein